MKNKKYSKKIFLFSKFFILPIFILAGFFICSSISQADPQVDMTQETARNFIIDGYPFIFNNNFNSFNNVSNGFNVLSLNADNPFSNALDRSVYLENGRSNNYENLADYLQPISGNGFSVSWWYKWSDYSGSGSIEISDQSANILLKGYLGRNANRIYTPSNTGGISWVFYNLQEGEMGDGAWHQFIMASDGHLITVYMDGQAKAKGIFNNPVDYTGAEVDYLIINGMGTKKFDEIILWDKYISESDANLIYNYGSFSQGIETPPYPADMTQGNAADFIADGFPFSLDNNYNSFKGVTGGFGVLPLNLDNPFSDASDRSLFLDNNGSNYPSQLSEELGPLLSGNLALSWWFKWIDYSGTGRIQLKDSSERILFKADLGKYGDIVYAPDNIGGMFWEFNNLDILEMGDGSWHQFALTSNGYYMDVYMDGELKAHGTYNNFVDYAGKQINRLEISGSGCKMMDEMLIWDRYISENDADLIYNYGSFKDYDPNQILDPVIIESFNQFKADGETVLYEQEITAGDSVVFKAVVSDPDGGQVKLQVEVKEYPNLFMLSPTIDDDKLLNSDFVFSGSEATATTSILADGEYHWRARAVDENGNASEWQHFGYGGVFDLGFDFKVKTVPLYTQVRSDYPSKLLTKEWSEKEYAKGDTQIYWCGSKIKDCGCAITSAVMTLRYHDITEDVEDNDINPGIINQWLKNAATIPIGYYIGNINWVAVEKYARHPQTNKLRVVFNGKYNRNYKSPPYDNHQEIEEMLDDDLESYQPVIMRDDRIGHFFVATEKLANTYRINDPLWYNTKTLNQEITAEDDALPYDNYKRDYDNHYGGIRRFYALGPYDVGPFRFASLDFVIASPAELLVVDPAGKKLGKDPISGIEYEEISVGSYIAESIGNSETLGPSEHQIKSIWIPNPMDGEYQVKVIGTGQGSYDFYSTITDLDGNSQTYTFAGHTQTGLAAAYDLDYNSLNIDAVEIMPQDTIPPATTIIISGAQGENDWHISDVEISLHAQDNENGIGVFKTEYSLDNGDTWNKYIDLFHLTNEGIHTILYRSEDFVGNTEEIKTQTIKIDKTPPEAEIYFNIEEQKLVVEGVDSLTESPAVTQESECSGKKCKQKKYVYTIEDQAGHALKLHFTISEHKQKIMAYLNKMLYNNNEPINNNTRIDYVWTTKKKSKTIHFLSQTITNPHDFWIKALYWLKKDKTVILAKSQEAKEKIKQTFKGLIIVKLITQSGELQYEY